MKKVISFTLVVALLMSMCMLTAVSAEEIQLQALPEVGQVISGFRAEEIGFMDIVNAKTVLFEHEKTGAKLYYIQSRDIDRSFEVAFKTPAVDDTGANHILEHITISGSQKYPLKNVLFTRDLYDAVISFGQQSDEPVTRAQFFELILAGVPEPLSVAKQMGLLLGDGTGNFYENENLTMEQLAVILERLAVLNGVQLGGEHAVIADEANISSWAKNSVQALVASGVAKLDADGNYNPKGSVSASFVQIILNEFMLKLSGM